MKSEPKYKALLIIVFVLLIDQASKLWVRTHISPHTPWVIAPWFELHMAENPGMAFSMELPGQYGKLLLSWFRVFAIGGIGYMLLQIIREHRPSGLIYAGALIFSGAVGNLIDSVFYGVLFHYAPLMQGYVVDMLHFGLVQGYFPNWLPIWGGEDFEFFRPVFNIADAAITSGIFLIIIFQKRFFPEEMSEVPAEETPAVTD